MVKIMMMLMLMMVFHVVCVLQDYIDATYRSREEWILSSVLADDDIVLERNMFPYNTPKVRKRMRMRMMMMMTIMMTRGGRDDDDVDDEEGGG
jgi:hypothetical protein